ncbi:unnamed protein product [Caenorhabditis angaria]|uniref:Uncharacterized protein n=1 Tax=Caenorhabditis angaria TaxID=860376 RepID=A0A9P1IQF3_9PELO|nr:unnamed protein product [Caenorhabditis angaria]
MKRLWNKIGGNVKNGQFQKKAVEHVEKIEKGETKILAPKYPTEKPRAISEEVKKDLETKHEKLIGNMNKMNIKSTDPVERWTSTKDLPTRESEFLHRNDPIWEYGFYEPPVEKIPKDKLMFREALEYMRARQELEVPPTSEASQKQREQSLEFIENHAVSSRVNPETLDKIFEYFRPFERKDKQKVVNKHQLAALQDHLQGYSDQRMIMDEAKGLRENIRKIGKNEQFLSEYQRLEADEKQKVREAILQLRQEEHDRLNKRLQEIDQIEKTSKEAMKQAIEQKKNNN